MYSNKTVTILEDLIEDVEDLVYFADPKRQMLDSKSVHIRLKKIKKNLNLMSLELLLKAPKAMSEEIQKARKKQNNRTVQ
jgi:hypothetical protein